MSNLTDDEREALLRAWPWPREAATTEGGFLDVAATVERIVAARERAARAEALREAADALGADYPRDGACDWLHERADREDNADHGMCYVHGSAALAARLAEAWDRGYTSGHSNAMRRMSDEPDAPRTPNPYREEAPDA